MPNSFKRVYNVQPGDTLYSIANKFQTTVDKIITMNGLKSSVLTVGQSLVIQVNTGTSRIMTRQRAYNPVTAYTATRPILVNEEDINTGLYPVLNFRPQGAQYPYIYVPIAEFARVGANVNWEPQQQVLSVTTDYYELVEENERLRQLVEEGPTDCIPRYDEGTYCITLTPMTGLPEWAGAVAYVMDSPTAGKTIGIVASLPPIEEVGDYEEYHVYIMFDPERTPAGYSKPLYKTPETLPTWANRIELPIDYVENLNPNTTIYISANKKIGEASPPPGDLVVMEGNLNFCI